MGFPQRDFDQGEISGLNGGWISIIQTALIYDTRDFEPDPTSGYYFEIANEYSGILVRSLNLTNCFYKEKGFGSCLGKGQW
jgi:outer membrane protein assembly factor BamA